MKAAAIQDTKRESEEILKCMGKGSDSGFDIFAAALALAALEQPRIELTKYRHHMEKIIGDVKASAKESLSSLEECIVALRQAIVFDNGYHGDIETYDDIQNASIMRVIDRRKGLPVSLGILYLQAARAQGWGACGLNFPGHFLIQLEYDGQRAIIDPFSDGSACVPYELRQRLKATIGNEAELTPQYYAAVTDRDVLLRLQNNVKLRYLQLGESTQVIRIIKVMLLFAPTETSLWFDMAAQEAKLGNLQAASNALDEYLKREFRNGPRQEAALLLQHLKRQLN